MTPLSPRTPSNKPVTLHCVCLRRVWFQEFDSSRAFVTIALFNLMRFPFAFMPMGFMQYIQAKVASQRVARLLVKTEVQAVEDSEHTPAFIKDGTFDWNTASTNPLEEEGLGKKRGRGKGKGRL